MLETILQWWGGLFYLLNKIFFSFAERSEESAERRWRIASWAVYLIGLPPWLILFTWRHNWIAFGVEAGGAPAMFLGLVVAIRGIGKVPKWLDRLVLVTVVLGLAYSLYDFRGITAWTQVCELGLVTGFFIGTYLLAKIRPVGYLWFLLMNGSALMLFVLQKFPWLVFQQALSIAFIFDAYIMAIRKRKSRLAALAANATAPRTT